MSIAVKRRTRNKRGETDTQGGIGQDTAYHVGGTMLGNRPQHDRER